MPTCIAFGCSNNSQNKKDSTSSVSFFRFPLKNHQLLKQWLDHLNRKYEPTENTRLCSEHFEANCFEGDLFHKFSSALESKIPRRKLKPDAVPTIFEKSTEKMPSKERSCSIKRAKQREHEEVSENIHNTTD